MADLTSFAAIETAWLHFKDTAGNLMYKDGDTTKPCRAEYYGPGTRQNAQMKAKAQTRSFQRLRKKGNVEISADESIQERAEDLASVTKQFENMDYKGLTGRELIVGVYSDLQLGFLVEQGAEHQADWENFTPSSATS